ncbi:spore germination protein [Virgibacillus salarius]|uniref:spore germination protein n=1 Tax=Virgibacillus salarius TaxID=447199 RepID=UPI002491DEF1|nr:spore germination protein [Virgibacillus salarius]WBX78724.1 spore germination protein [Virgibacillus salarius]
MTKYTSQQITKKLRSSTLRIDQLQDFFSVHADVEYIPSDEAAIGSFYVNGMVDSVQLNNYYNQITTAILEDNIHTNNEELPPLYVIDSFDDVISKILSGYFILYKVGENVVYAVNIAKIPQRNPEESNTELSIKGPKDGFTEDVNVNIALIRKRLKTEDLYNESFELGSISKTKTSLIYIHNKANMQVIKEVRQRLNNIKVESILSSGQLEQWVSDRTFSLFPLFDNVARPDFAVECLLRGRFIIIIDGSPLILIGPINLFELLKSPEDVHFPYHIVAFQRVFRLIGLLLSVFLPGFWIAIASVNIDLLPFNLLATVVEARGGMPLPFILEFLFLLVLFEILKEAGVRMPKPVGQTIAIVGGIIIGDALIRAGLASATLIVVIALSTLSTYTLVNQSLIGTVSIVRVYMILISGFLGIYGFLLGLLSIVVYLARLESFSLSYLEPVVALSFKEFLAALLVNPFKRRNNSAQMLQKRRR